MIKLHTDMKSHKLGGYYVYLVHANWKHKWKELSTFDKRIERRGWYI